MGRTNIVIDEKLIQKAVEVTGARSRREAVDIALRHLVDKDSLYHSMRRISGKLKWEGNLHEWRKRRT
jgi:Arc/MetJ family transcription regulator